MPCKDKAGTSREDKDEIPYDEEEEEDEELLLDGGGRLREERDGMSD